MRIVVQRVARAAVRVDGAEVGRIGAGLVLLVGVAEGDTADDAARAAAKVARLRIFRDQEGKMNRSVVDAGGAALVVSQFTLLADVRKGRRPSFVGAAHPNDAEALVEEVALGLEAEGIVVARGSFGAMMEVELVNDGPVTIVIDVEDGKVR